MGAEVNTTEKAIFILEKPELSRGAIAIGSPSFVGSSAFLFLRNIAERDSQKNTWLVCPHLSKPDKVNKYYMSSGLILIVFGKCFCEICLDMILAQDDLSELTASSSPMTDKLFQENIIEPLIHVNYSFSKSIGYIGDNEKSPTTWVCCPHLATETGLEKFYSNGGQICIFESYFTCQHCFDKIPTDSLVDLLYEGTSMPDSVFQKRIIDPLYPINYASLQAVGHFGF